MFDRLRPWLYRIRRRLRPAAPLPSTPTPAPPAWPERPPGAQWLESTYREPRSSSFLSLRPRELGYLLFLPSDAERGERLPLLLMLHGCNQSALEFAAGTRMNALAEQRRCAVLYPQQTRKANSLQCWNWFDIDALEGRGEASLIAQCLFDVTAHYPIDVSRTYVAGLSAGAAMAALLCTTHAHLFAACALHSGVMYGAAASALQAYRVMHSGDARPVERTIRDITQRFKSMPAPVPTLILHGDHDETVNAVNAEQIVQQLCLRAKASDPRHAPVREEGPLWISGAARRYRQQDFQQHEVLVARTILIEGLGHAWSGGDGQQKFFDPDGPAASDLIIDFLLQYRRPALADDSATPPGGAETQWPSASRSAASSEADSPTKV